MYEIHDNSLSSVWVSERVSDWVSERSFVVSVAADVLALSVSGTKQLLSKSFKCRFHVHTGPDLLNIY